MLWRENIFYGGRVVSENAAMPRLWLRAGPRLSMASIFAALALLPGLLGCASGDRSLDAVDPGAVVSNPTYEQVYVIFQRACIPCHTDGEGGDGRVLVVTPGLPRGAGGVGPDLTTCAAILDNLDDSWGVIRKNTMPPGAWPRLTSEEKLLIERWIDNGAPAPCTK